MHRLLLAWVVVIGLGLQAPARAQPVIADLSDHLIAITTAFAGTDVLLYGAVENPGGDIVVLVFGPEEEVRVRRKARLLLFWLNAEEVTFRGVPSFYAVASSRPLELVASEEVLTRYRIGTGRLPLEAVGAAGYSTLEIGRFRTALIRNKVRQGLYVEKPQAVTFLAGKLFRTRLTFPANVPPGPYFIETFYFRDGRLEHAQSNVLMVSKVGLEAEVYDLSRRRPLLYGMGVIAMAIMAGWTANLVFARR